MIGQYFPCALLALVNDGKFLSAAGSVTLPLTAARTLPIKLFGLEATMAATIPSKFLRIAPHKTLDQG